MIPEIVMTLILTTGAFGPGGAIPARYTCDGADRSPALEWTGAPAGTVTFALIVEDPDAPRGTFTHWVLFDVPGDRVGLPEGVAATERLDWLGGAVQGRNDFRRTGYGGPCPPPGPAHHYHFRLFALNTALALKPGASRREVEQAIKGHVLAEATLIGTYARGGRRD